MVRNSSKCPPPEYTLDHIRSQTSQWRHDEREGVSNNQHHHCLLNRSFRRRSKKTSKLRVSSPLRGIYRWPVNSPHKWPVMRKMLYSMTSSWRQRAIIIWSSSIQDLLFPCVAATSRPLSRYSFPDTFLTRMWRRWFFTNFCGFKILVLDPISRHYGLLRV